MVVINSKLKAHLIARTADDTKAVNLLIVDITKLSAFADYFVIASGTSVKHVQSICDNITESLKIKGEKLWHYEGYEYGQWIVLDFVDVVVHVFEENMRHFYDLEHLWQDAEIKRLDELEKNK